MSRLVQPIVRSTRAVAYQRPDEYQDRVAKYVPAEVVGAYVSLDGILATSPPQKPRVVLQLVDSALAQAATTAPAPEAAPTFGRAIAETLMTLPGMVFLLCLVLAPLYVFVLARRAGTAVWKAQALIAALAFLVWAYAIKGAVFFSNPALDKWVAQFDRSQFYDPKWGAALLVLFSLAVAFYQPKTD